MLTLSKVRYDPCTGHNRLWAGPRWDVLPLAVVIPAAYQLKSNPLASSSVVSINICSTGRWGIYVWRNDWFLETPRTNLSNVNSSAPACYGLLLSTGFLYNRSRGDYLFMRV